MPYETIRTNGIWSPDMGIPPDTRGTPIGLPGVRECAHTP